MIDAQGVLGSSLELCGSLASCSDSSHAPAFRSSQPALLVHGYLMTSDAAKYIAQRLVCDQPYHVLQDGLTSDEMLLLGLEQDSEKLPFFSGCHVYPLFPGESARYSLLVWLRWNWLSLGCPDVCLSTTADL